jgi:hypothetical protein
MNEYPDPRRFVPAERIIEGLYIALLGRPVDPEGLISYSNLIVDGASIGAIVSRMVKSDEFKGRLYNFIKGLE